MRARPPVLALALFLCPVAAFGQARQLKPSSGDLGISLERYCAAQLGRSDLDEADLAGCRERLQAEVDEFSALDAGSAPVAGRTDPARDMDFDDPGDAFEVDDLDGGATRGRTARAAKKSAPSSEEDFEAEDEPEDEEFGFNFEFEGQQQEAEDPVEDFDFDPIDDPDAEPLGDLEDAPRPKPSTARPAPTGSAAPTPSAVQLDVLGKSPLGDNYAPQIVAVDRDSVVVELPILLGRSRADFDGIAYCVVAEVLADGRKVAEARQEVTSASLAEFGPSFAFVKLLAPVTAKTGELEVRVSKASSMTGKPTQLFARKVSYQLP